LEETTVKRSLFSAVFPFLCVCLLFMTTSPFPARAEGVVSYWAGEGNAQDSVGGNHGTIVGGVSYVPGVVGQGFAFNGVDGAIVLPDAPNLRLTQSLTITAWIKVTAYPATQSMVLFRGDERGGFDPYYLGIHANGSIMFHIGGSEDSNGVDIYTSIPLNTFVFVRASLDDATGRMSLYLDNELKVETFTPVRPFQDLSPLDLPGVGIGAHGGEPTSSYNLHFSGVIDELTLYDTPEPTNNVSFSGRLTLQGAINQAQPVVFEFRPTDGTQPFLRTLTLNPNRTFQINEIPKGNYNVWIKADRWLAKVIAADMTNSSVSGVQVTLNAGDANNDNSVDVLDLDVLIRGFDTAEGDAGFLEGADFNADDFVDVLDLDLLVRNFDETGDA
jgi:hypothetical protein